MKVSRSDCFDQAQYLGAGDCTICRNWFRVLKGDAGTDLTPSIPTKCPRCGRDVVCLLLGGEESSPGMLRLKPPTET